LASGTVITGDNTRQSWMNITANDVVVYGPGATFMDTAKDGNLAFQGSLDISGDNVQILGTSGQPIRFTNGRWSNIYLRSCNNVLIQYARVDHAPTSGITGDQAPNARILDCELDHNDTTMGGVSGGIANHAGGVKLVIGPGSVVQRNNAHHNGGEGIWFDIDCDGVTCTGNTVHHNGRPGIHFEISNGATITGNKAYENAWGSSVEWGFAANILISSAKNANVTGNFVAWGGKTVGIGFVSQNRPDAPFPLTGNAGAGNTIAVSSGRDAIGNYIDWSDPSGGANATEASNTIVAAGNSVLAQ